MKFLHSFLPLLALAATSLVSCERDHSTRTHCERAEVFTVTEMGLTCGLLLVSDHDSTVVLEPTNLTNYLSMAHDGQKVAITYEELRHASVCMRGKVVEITCLEDR